MALFSLSTAEFSSLTPSLIALLYHPYISNFEPDVLALDTILLQVTFFITSYIVYKVGFFGLLSAMIYKEYEFYRLTRPNNRLLERIRKRIYYDHANEGVFTPWTNFKMWVKTGFPGHPHYRLKDLSEISE